MRHVKTILQLGVMWVVVFVMAAGPLPLGIPSAQAATTSTSGITDTPGIRNFYTPRLILIFDTSKSMVYRPNDPNDDPSVIGEDWDPNNPTNPCDNKLCLGKRSLYQTLPQYTARIEMGLSGYNQYYQLTSQPATWNSTCYYDEIAQGSAAWNTWKYTLPTDLTTDPAWPNMIAPGDTVAHQTRLEATNPTGLTHAQCWAHGRRALFDAHAADPDAVQEGLEQIAALYRIEEEITRIHQRKVPLANGGSIVIEQTEALVAIDVNSGNFRANGNAEETAYQINLQAAKEIARQLRLRDLAGVIVNDFIDMREEGHRRNVERALRDAVARDRSRIKILRMSQFGIIEMTRQRIRPSLKRSIYQDCPHCAGNGQVKTCESMSIEVMRMLQLAAHLDNVQRIEITVTEDVANYLLNKKRREIGHLEEAGNLSVSVTGVPGAPPEALELVCYDKNNNEVKFPPTDEPPPRGRR